MDRHLLKIAIIARNHETLQVIYGWLQKLSCKCRTVCLHHYGSDEVLNIVNISLKISYGGHCLILSTLLVIHSLVTAFLLM